MYCSKCGSKLEDKAKYCHNCGEEINYNQKDKEASQDNKQKQNKNYLTVSKENRKKGILWLTVPFGSLILILVFWAISQFVVGAMGNVSTLGETIVEIANVLLGLLGVVSVVGIMVGIPLGLVYLNKKTLEEGASYDERSGKGDKSEVPEEIKKWSWGAAGLSWIWGAYHNVWLSFLIFVPYLNFIWWIVLGVKGNEWAWKKTKWKSVDHFLKKQKRWGRWGLAIFIITFMLGLISGLIAE